MGPRRPEPRRRHRLGLTSEAIDNLRAIRHANRSAYREIDRFIETLRDDPHRGYPLKGEWEGWRAAHVYRDRYRVIWSFTGELAEITVYRVGLRFDPQGGAIYDAAPPSSGLA